MRLLVTGGCGFIGTNFIQGILTKHPDWIVVNLDKLTYAGNRHNLVKLESSSTKDLQHYIFTHGDIADRNLVISLLEKHRLEAVINFAAESHVDRSINATNPFFNTNIMGTQNLLECSRISNIKRFVQVSTDEVYGSLGPSGNFTESTPLMPNSPYAASKASADLICRAYLEAYGLPIIITRCSNNYGPYQLPEKLIPLMFIKAQANKPLPVYGQGLNIRDWIWVEDHCLGVELALLRGIPGEVYNFGGASEYTNLEIVKAILRYLGKSESLIKFVTDRPGHDLRYAVDFSKASKELNFTPSLNFEVGLARTLNWYRDNQFWLTSVQSGDYRQFMDQWYKERV